MSRLDIEGFGGPEIDREYAYKWFYDHPRVPPDTFLHWQILYGQRLNFE